MKSIKSVITVGAMALALPLGVAPAALAADAPAIPPAKAEHPHPGKHGKPGKPGDVQVFAHKAVAGSEDQALAAAKAGVAKEIAEYEKKTGTSCTILHQHAHAKQNGDQWVAVAAAKARCVKKS